MTKVFVMGNTPISINEMKKMSDEQLLTAIRIQDRTLKRQLKAIKLNKIAGSTSVLAKLRQESVSRKLNQTVICPSLQQSLAFQQIEK